MLLPRVIPCLLLSGKGLVKGSQFKNHAYIGDPVNAVRIFNDKKADEIILFDIDATREGRIPEVSFIQQIANESLMPFAIGGGIRTVDDMRMMLNAGAEKVCLCTAAVEAPQVIKQGAGIFGSQCITVAIDVKKNIFGKAEVYVRSGTRATGLNPIQHAIGVEKLGAGEILINSIDREGCMTGYDLELVAEIARSVRVPVIAGGGAGSVDDLKKALDQGASAVSAGSMFVFHGRKRGVLISYPTNQEFTTIRGD